MRISVLAVCFVLFQFSASAQQWDWAQSYESPNLHGSYFQAVTHDGLGSVYTGGVVQDTVYFNTDTLWSDYAWDPTLNGDMSLVKHDIGTGEELWVQRFGGRGYSRVNGLTCDAAGNIYVAAHFMDTLLMQGDTLLADGFTDGLLIKMDPDGQVIWYRQMETTHTAQVETMAISSSGTIIVSVLFSGAAWWDGVYIGNTTTWQKQAVIGGFSGDGDLLWHHGFPASTVPLVTDIETLDDKIWVCGWFKDDLFFPPYSATATGLWDGFVARLDTLGNVDWLRTCGTDYKGAAHKIEVDADMNVFVAGVYSNTLDWGGTAPLLTSLTGGLEDAYIVKLDPQGNGIWANNYSGLLDQDYLNGLAMDDAGNVYGTGYYRSAAPITLANSNLPSSGGFPVLLVLKVDPDGNDQWAVGVVPGNGNARGMTIDGNDLVVAGWADGPSEFGSISFSPGAYRMRPTVAKMDIGNGVPTALTSIQDEIPATLSPNPTNGPIAIQLEGPNDDLTLTVTDLTGRVIMERSWSDAQRIEFNIEGVAGIYLVRLTSGNGQVVWKVTRE